MHVFGHVSIVQEALKLAPAISKKDIADLLRGTRYPDMSCGSVDVDGANELVLNLQECSLTDLFKYVFRDLSLPYQSHNGIYSSWHAMSYDPRRVVRDVAKDAFEYVMICVKLAFETRSYFWIGFALHTVVDAYSPAHVVREPEMGGDSFAEEFAYFVAQVAPPAANLSASMMRTLITEVVAKAKIGLPPSSIVRSYPTRMQRRVAFILFDHQQREGLRRLKEAKYRAAATRTTQDLGRKIVTFLDYNTQSGLRHAIDDTLTSVRFAGLLGRCISDVRDILAAFAEETNLPALLKRTSAVLLTRTFHIHPACLNSATGIDFAHQEVRREPLKRGPEATGATYVSRRANVNLLSDGTYAVHLFNSKETRVAFASLDVRRRVEQGRAILEYYTKDGVIIPRALITDKGRLFSARAPRLTKTRQDSPRLTKTRQDSPRLAKTHQDSPRLTKTHQDSLLPTPNEMGHLL